MAQFFILVVDDSPSFSRALARLLATDETTVETAHSVEEARISAAKRRPDMVFLDVFLKPNSDGGSNELAFVDFRGVPTFRMSSEIAEAKDVIAEGVRRFCHCEERNCTACTRAQPIDKQDLQAFEDCVRRARV